MAGMIHGTREILEGPFGQSRAVPSFQDPLDPCNKLETVVAKSAPAVWFSSG